MCDVVGTLWHGARADVGGHAAAQGIRGVVAGQDLDLVAGEVVQVGDHGGLLGQHLQLHLKTPGGRGRTTHQPLGRM